MNVFEVREQLVSDYRAFTAAFVEPRDPRLAAFLTELLNSGAQWPDPWLSLNPSFASGGTVTELVTSGLLHPETDRIFRAKNDANDTGARPITFHQHQKDAIAAARSGGSYVLTTGTGSGKSLGYIVPIVDDILRNRASLGKGVKAIIVYPMNALANSQLGELEKFLRYGYSDGKEPVTFARYTGQESTTKRDEILANPPDILLTNYVMLDLVLTRPDERRRLVTAAAGLRFLVLDELHTYRGRQGADVAMLIRRVRNACASPNMRVVGTSATMSSEGTPLERQSNVARVATRLFGSEVTAERVIGETLVRATANVPSARSVMKTAIARAFNDDDRLYDDLANDALASWIESTFGLANEPSTRQLVRAKPTTVSLAAADLASIVDEPVQECERAIRSLLLAGSRSHHPETGRPLFAFRIHQFVSKGDTLHVTLEPEAERHISGQYQLTVPGEPDKALLPLGFCRECGQEYYVVAKVDRSGHTVFVPRTDIDASGGDTVTGYLYVSSDLPWPLEPENEDRLPDHWLVEHDDGSVAIQPSKAKYIPKKVWLTPDGGENHDGRGLPAWFMSTPFAFCLRCRVSYEQVRGADFSKLATLDQEGRSSAMTIISASIVRALRGLAPGTLDPKARKLLTFVDNRQDAALQAGHFNDFAQVAQLRGALARALADRPDGLTHETVAQAVTAALGLTPADFAASPEARFSAAAAAEKALRQLVEYRLYVDLKRGWRVTMPNLEQTGRTDMKRGFARLCWETGARMNTLSHNNVVPDKGRRPNLSFEFTLNGHAGGRGMLSQGQMNALALATLLPRATDPRLPTRFVILDDPVVALDEVRIDRLAQLLLRYARQRGAQIIVFTHDFRLERALKAEGPSEVRMIRLERQGGHLKAKPVDDPAHRLWQLSATAAEELPADVARRSVPVLTRRAMESAANSRYRAKKGWSRDKWATEKSLRLRLRMGGFTSADLAFEAMVVECDDASHHGLADTRCPKEFLRELCVAAPIDLITGVPATYAPPKLKRRSK